MVYQKSISTPGLRGPSAEEQEQSRKAGIWVEKFIEAFGPDVQSNTVAVALAIEKAFPGHTERLKKAFEKIAPPGSPQAEHGGIELLDRLPKRHLRAIQKAEAVAQSVPVDEAYEQAYKKALALADHVTSAIIRKDLSPPEHEAIIEHARVCADQHLDDGLRAIANTILVVARTAERVERSMRAEAAAKPPAPAKP